MAHWESDRYIDEIYDEWCGWCNDHTEHSMGACLDCAQAPPGTKNALVKKKKTTVQKTTQQTIMESDREESS